MQAARKSEETQKCVAIISKVVDYWVDVASNEPEIVNEDNLWNLWKYVGSAEFRDFVQKELQTKLLTDKHCPFLDEYEQCVDNDDINNMFLVRLRNEFKKGAVDYATVYGLFVLAQMASCVFRRFEDYFDYVEHIDIDLKNTDESVEGTQASSSDDDDAVTSLT